MTKKLEKLGKSVKCRYMWGLRLVFFCMWFWFMWPEWIRWLFLISMQRNPGLDSTVPVNHGRLLRKTFLQSIFKLVCHSFKWNMVLRPVIVLMVKLFYFIKKSSNHYFLKFQINYCNVQWSGLLIKEVYKFLDHSWGKIIMLILFSPL